MDQQFSFPASFGTRLSVSVDTEEEFEWGAPFSRDRHGTMAVAAIRTGQRYFAGAGIRPIYYLDTPVVDSDDGAAIFSELPAAGSADIGVHLHPWVTPPFVEEVCARNSYAGNLPEHVERAKLRHIRDRILERTGVRPIAYRAGRYGMGPNTHRLLVEEGFRCDSSVRAKFDYREDGGPDYRQSTLRPSWTGPDAALLELPLTTLFTGFASRWGKRVFPLLPYVPGGRSIVARLGAMERIPLTPEGIPAAKACEAIDVGLDCGLRLFSISFHSPSLAPGYTPYVRTEADLADFYRWFDTVLNHCAKRGISPAGLAEIIAAAESARR